MNKFALKIFIFIFFFSNSIFYSDAFVSKNDQGVKKNLHVVRKFDSIRETFDNFYAVEKDMFYRSKQLSSTNLDFYIKKYGIKSVVNLRGVNKHRKWWKKERQVTLDNNVYFYNISMRAEKLPSKHNIKKLINIFESAPKPILVHCFYGADRTGEACAVWSLMRDEIKKVDLNESKKKALEQLSIKYGHIKKIMPAKTFFIELWQGKQWAIDEYDPSLYKKYYDKP